MLKRATTWRELEGTEVLYLLVKSSPTECNLHADIPITDTEVGKRGTARTARQGQIPAVLELSS